MRIKLLLVLVNKPVILYTINQLYCTHVLLIPVGSSAVAMALLAR
jgi:hypothetical protein